jgi:hypothetical protein
MFRTEIAEPASTKLRTDIRDPTLTKDRHDNVDARVAQLITLRWDTEPMFVKPTTDIPEPTRMQERRLRALPRLAHKTVDRDPPPFTFDRTEKELPQCR